MKRKFAILVCATVPAMAMAQSSVTIFGILDAGVGRISAKGAGHTTGLLFGGSSTSRLGFRGTEDLGGGLAASFWLEGQVANDTGSGATNGAFDFRRRSTVSLSGPFGEVRLGRDFTPSYLNMISFDAWSQRGFGDIEYSGYGAAGTADYIRTNNGVSYYLPASLGGFYGAVQYAFGEQPSTKTSVPISTASAVAATTKKTGNYFGGRLGYATGPLDVSASYGLFSDTLRTVVTGATTTFYASDYKVANAGVGYDFGFIKPMLLVQSERMDGQGAISKFGYDTVALSATAPIGAGVLKVGVSHYDIKNSSADFNKLSLGYVYNLSKRTAVYADLGRINNKGNSQATFIGIGGSLATPTPRAGGSTTGIAFGVKHAF